MLCLRSRVVAADVVLLFAISLKLIVRRSFQKCADAVGMFLATLLVCTPLWM